MKILVMSDSHGDIVSVRGILRRHAGHVGGVVHLGDGYADIVEAAREFPHIALYAVAGNCDDCPGAPEKLVFGIGGTTVLAAHGHHYNVKTSFDRLCYAAQEAGADLCLFGHTHRAESFEYAGATFLNPGAVLAPHGGKPKYAIIDTAAAPVGIEFC
ncbi:MAG: metallophosphoesterase [Defluviitaleaceae bacterium]|nr:metallophosphoesterase [Defluviitaleaceae bacterium]